MATRPITLFTIQFGDMPLEDLCQMAQKAGFEGLELSAAHVDVKRAASDAAYVEEIKATLAKYGLGCWSISTTWLASVSATPSPALTIPVWTALLPQSWLAIPRQSRSGQSRR